MNKKLAPSLRTSNAKKIITIVRWIFNLISQTSAIPKYRGDICVNTSANIVPSRQKTGAAAMMGTPR